LDLQSALAEVQRLREENVRLRRILQDHGIQLPVVQSPNGIPVTTSALPSPHTLVLKAEQRIALFRSLFHGRDDVYAVRWENADGRFGYMPKADRDWKAYLRARDQERKKVDRQTRKFRPLTDEVGRITAVVEQGERWRNDFMRRFRGQDLQRPSEVPFAIERRNVGNLLAAAHARAQDRARLLNEQRIAETAKRRAEDEASRTRYLGYVRRPPPRFPVRADLVDR
jgi:hypothetical protein